MHCDAIIIGDVILWRVNVVIVVFQFEIKNNPGLNSVILIKKSVYPFKRGDDDSKKSSSLFSRRYKKSEENLKNLRKISKTQKISLD